MPAWAVEVIQIWVRLVAAGVSRILVELTVSVNVVSLSVFAVHLVVWLVILPSADRPVTGHATAALELGSPTPVVASIGLPPPRYAIYGGTCRGSEHHLTWKSLGSRLPGLHLRSIGRG